MSAYEPSVAWVHTVRRRKPAVRPSPCGGCQKKNCQEKGCWNFERWAAASWREIRRCFGGDLRHSDPCPTCKSRTVCKAVGGTCGARERWAGSPANQ